MSNSSECIKVMIRCRPLNKSEKDRGNHSIVNVNHERSEITIAQPNQSKVFSYDQVFDENDSQQQVYEQTAFQLVEQVVEGYNGTIFAYGQTGCGKTHSMIGVLSSEEHKGLIPRTFQHIMSVIDTAEQKKFLVRCSYIEIYNEDIHDLLSKDVKQKKDLKESPDKGLFIKDLSMMVCKQIDDMEEYMNIGNNCRSTGATLMNQDSSRSHSIFTIYIECQKTVAQAETITAGKLNLVDLAGSERQSKTGATGDRLKEANKINLSLSALGNVISALVDGKSSHVPYRDSKLTRLLQDSLGGNTKTIMIAAISPANYNYDETLGTLRYASRAKNIVNKPKINEDPKDALLKEYQDELNKLRAMLQNQGQSSDVVQFNGQDNGQMNDLARQKQIQQEKENMAQQLQIKDQQTALERQEKERLEQLLKEYEKNMVKGGGQKDSKIQQKYKKIRQSLQEQKKQQEQLLIDKKKQEEELLEIKQNYNSVQEEINELRKVYGRLKKKYKASELEIKDIQRENEIQKQELLQTIRIQTKENSFYEQIAAKMINDNEIDIVRAQSEWDDNQKNYIVPLFVVKDKKVKFPNLTGQRLIDFIEKEKQNRHIQIVGSKNEDRETKKDKNNQDKYSYNNNMNNNQYSGNKNRVLQPLNEQEQENKMQKGFYKENNDSENVDPIEEENQYDQDFE